MMALTILVTFLVTFGFQSSLANCQFLRVLEFDAVTSDLEISQQQEIQLKLLMDKRAKADKKKRKELAKELQNNNSKIVQKELVKAYDTQTLEYEVEMLAEVLLDHQASRLNDLMIQVLDAHCLLRPYWQQKFKLSKKQVAKIESHFQEFRTALNSDSKKDSRKRGQKERPDLRNRILAELSSGQRKEFGKAFNDKLALDAVQEIRRRLRIGPGPE